MDAEIEGLSLSRLERTPDKREVGGSSPLKPKQSIMIVWMITLVIIVCTLKTEY